MTVYVLHKIDHSYDRNPAEVLAVYANKAAAEKKAAEFNQKWQHYHCQVIEMEVVH